MVRCHRHHGDGVVIGAMMASSTSRGGRCMRQDGLMIGAATAPSTTRWRCDAAGCRSGGAMPPGARCGGVMLPREDDGEICRYDETQRCDTTEKMYGGARLP